jgi:predicted nuclease with TOPRIM domain
MKQKIVEIPANEFQELVDELKKCREEKKLLEEANKKLNAEIKEYNEKFASNFSRE